MNLTRNYGAEVLADIEAGEQPNLRTMQRAIAQADMLRAQNARLVEALRTAIEIIDRLEYASSCALGLSPKQDAPKTQVGNAITEARAFIANEIARTLLSEIAREGKS